MAFPPLVRLLQITVATLLLHHGGSFVHGLPFKIRGGTSCDDEEGGLSATSEAPAATAASVSITAEDGSVINLNGIKDSFSRLSASKKSPVVESYFAASSASDQDGDAKKDSLLAEIHNQTLQLAPFLISTRRTLHKYPELMYQERVTSSIVQQILHNLDIAHTAGWAVNVHPQSYDGEGGYGIVADIGTGHPPCVLIRGDMDALPILEKTDTHDKFERSTANGRMHACGHDAHMTMVLGAAAVLKNMERSINGTVRVMFQPAEEGGAGGKRMREEGALTKYPKVQHAYAMHVWPGLDSGAIGGRPGPLLAAADRFDIIISGVGGHAAMPHLTVDPIIAGSAIVLSLQSIVSRNLSPLDSGVVSVTKFDAGESFNIIPDSATIMGTIRALTTETLTYLRERVERIVNATAEAHGCNMTLSYMTDYYPPTVNDPTLWEFAKNVAADVAEDKRVVEVEPTMGAEDFAFVAEDVPSAFFLLGQGGGVNPPTSFNLHHPQFALDESVLSRGVELHVNLALQTLRKLAAETSNDAAQSKKEK